MERGDFAAAFEDDEQTPEHQGLQLFTMLGLGHYAGRRVMTDNGVIMNAEDFLDICGEHARVPVLAFMEMDQTDPSYEEAKQGLSLAIEAYIHKKSV